MSRVTQDSLIDLQVQEWEKARKERKSTQSAPPQYSPIVTISRQIGSGGVEIGEMIARTLKFQFLDRAIVDSIAERAAIRNSAVESLDERSFGILEECLRTFIVPNDLSRSKYIEHLAAVLVVAAEHGKAVIVGRGANFMLKAFPLFRVRVVCPVKIRIERIAEKNHISTKESEEMVRRCDTERASFVKNCFHADIDDCRNYDMMINTESIDEHKSADIIVQAFKIAYP